MTSEVSGRDWCRMCLRLPACELVKLKLGCRGFFYLKGKGRCRTTAGVRYWVILILSIAGRSTSGLTPQAMSLLIAQTTSFG